MSPSNDYRGPLSVNYRKDWYGYKWFCTISGPWYDDSNPEGHGETKEEAYANALNMLKAYKKQIDDYLNSLPKENTP